MSPDERPVNDLAALEAALASLAPRADRLDRNRLMFLAGQASATPPPSAVPVASASPRLRIWQAAFAAMTAVAASLLVALVTQPGPQVVERLVPVIPESNEVRPVEADRQPAMPPDVATVAQVADGNEGLESSPAWPWEPFVLGRSDWRRQHLAHAGLSRAAYARWLEQGPENGIRTTRESAGSSAHVPTIEPPPVSYRDLLDSLLKETGSNSPQGES